MLATLALKRGKDYERRDGVDTWLPVTSGQGRNSSLRQMPDLHVFKKKQQYEMTN